MFSENLRNFRKQKGLSQEELAERLGVVRQTISKWEKGLSLPDADLLIHISEIFETSVGTLLGETVNFDNKLDNKDKDIISEKLEQLNIILAERNRRSRRIWSIVKKVLITIAIITILSILFTIIAFTSFKTKTSRSQESIKESIVNESID